MWKLSALLFLISSNAYAIDYSDALGHARQAFLVQSGIQDGIQKTGDYVVAEIKRMGLATPMGAGLFTYKIYRDRALTFPISHKTRVTLNLNSVTFTIHY